jgi:CheY-like chemotaxis protein
MRISISDTGYGITEANMKRLFVPFERLHSEKTQTEGTGLGLALSKRLTEAMGGMLGAISTPGEGSTFYIRLPIVPDPMEAIGQTHTEIEEELGLRDWGTDTKTVLLIEDNISNFKLVQTLLAGRPYINILAAMQGQLGLEMAETQLPDLVLLDLHLPDMPGQDVLRRLLDNPQTSHIPIIVVSADATPSQIERLLAAGASAYLTKPLDVKEFLRLIDTQLHKEDSENE